MIKLFRFDKISTSTSIVSVDTLNINSELALPFKKRPVSTSQAFRDVWLDKAVCQECEWKGWRVPEQQDQEKIRDISVARQSLSGDR